MNVINQDIPSTERFSEMSCCGFPLDSVTAFQHSDTPYRAECITLEPSYDKAW